MLLKIINFLALEIASIRHAIVGIYTFIKEEKHARIHSLGAGGIISFGYFFQINGVEWCFLLLAISAVIVSEILNSAVERLVDLCSPQFHPLAKKAKDLAAASVLVASVIGAIISLIIFMPYLWLLTCQSTYIS